MGLSVVVAADLFELTWHSGEDFPPDELSILFPKPSLVGLSLFSYCGGPQVVWEVARVESDPDPPK